MVPITTGAAFARMAGFAVPLAGAVQRRSVWSDATDRGRSTLPCVARGRIERLSNEVLDHVLARVIAIFA